MSHIIICGLNKLGYHIAQQLSKAHIRVVIVDDEPDERLARLVKSQETTFLREDSRTAAVLVEAGIHEAIALIAVKPDDLHNLETILAANQEAPTLRSIGSFSNKEIGKQLTKTVANAYAINIADKAGPAFVAAALPSRILSVFKLKAEPFFLETVVVMEAIAPYTATLSELYGDTTVLALLEANPNPDGHETTYPKSSTQVKAGTRIILVGTLHEFEQLPTVKLTREEIVEAAEVQAEGKPRPMLIKRVNRLDRFRRLFTSIIQNIERNARVTLAIIALVVVVGTLVLKQFYVHTDRLGQVIELDWISAFYFTITVVTTTGFGDFNLAYQAWPLQLFGVFLMLVGATTVALLYAFLTNYLIKVRLEDEVGRQQAIELEDHIIVCGLGTVGYSMIKGLLERGQQVVVIERNHKSHFTSQVRALGVPIIYTMGDSLLETVQSVNVAKAHCIALMSDDDLINLETALVARSIKSDLRVVLRLFDNSLADKVGRTFDIHIALSVSTVATPAFLAAAFHYEELSSFYVDYLPFTAAQEVVGAGSELVGQTLGEVEKQLGVKILAHVEQATNKEPVFHPALDKIVSEADKLVFVGSYDKIINLRLLNPSGKAAK